MSTCVYLQVLQHSFLQCGLPLRHWFNDILLWFDPLGRFLWLIPKLLVTPCCRLESQSLSENWFNSNLSAISGTPSPPLASWAESQDFSSVDFGSVLPASWPPPTWPRRQSCGWNCFPRNHGSGKMGPWKTTLISKGAIVCFHVFLEKESIVCVLCLFAWVSCLQWLFIFCFETHEFKWPSPFLATQVQLH